jgi:hypothetical protein
MCIINYIYSKNAVRAASVGRGNMRGRGRGAAGSRGAGGVQRTYIPPHMRGYRKLPVDVSTIYCVLPNNSKTKCCAVLFHCNEMDQPFPKKGFQCLLQYMDGVILFPIDLVIDIISTNLETSCLLFSKFLKRKLMLHVPLLWGLGDE